MPTPEQLRQRFLANPVLQPQEDVAIGASQPTIQPAMGSVIDFVPVLDPKDFDLSPADMGHQLPHLFPFHSVCKNGPLSAIHSMVTSESRTVAFLHHALTVALKAGNVDAAHYLLDSGAPIGRKTPDCILQAPADRQVPLFDLLAHHGWDVNTRGYDGNVLLPFVITNLDVLRWFLTHGANPNLGVHPNRPDSTVSGPSTESCNTLQLAAAHSTVEAAANMGSDEMKSVMAEGLATRKWVESGTEQA